MRRDNRTKNPIEVASIPIKGDAYSEIIEVRVPIRFYWCHNGDFDGIEIGPFKASLLPWSEQMVDRCLEAVKVGMETK